jgi:hypothetical protein
MKHQLLTQIQIVDAILIEIDTVGCFSSDKDSATLTKTGRIKKDKLLLTMNSLMYFSRNADMLASTS